MSNDEIQANTSRSEIAKINKRKVKKLKRPKVDKMHCLVVNVPVANTRYYFAKKSRLETKLEELIEENSNNDKFKYQKILKT